MIQRRLHSLLMMLAGRFGVALAASWLMTAPAFSSFDEVGAGARGAGMADAQTAVADDAAAPFYNPAGLVQVGERRLSAEMGQYARGLSDGSNLTGSFLGYTQPIVRGGTVLGVGYRTFGVTGLLQEQTYLVGAGHRIPLDPIGLGGVLSVGANAKLLQRAFTPGAEASNAFSDSGAATGQSDSVLVGNPRSSAFGFDAGLLYQFGPRLNTSVAAAAMNVNRPDIGIQASDKVPSIMKLGLAYHPRWGLLSMDIREAQRLGSATDTDLAFGMERYIRLGHRTAFTLRGGYATGSRDYKALTMGAAYSFGAFDLDYGFSFPIGNLTKTDGQQHLGLSYKFGAGSDRLTETQYEKIDLIHAFRYDSLTAHVLLAEVPALNTDRRSIADRMIVRRFSLNDAGLAQATAELQDALSDGPEWSSLVAGFTRDMLPEDQRIAAEALKSYTSGGVDRALTSLAMLSSEAQKRPVVVALRSMALGEKAASAFRAGNLKGAIEPVKMLSYLLPTSDVVRQALRQLESIDTTSMKAVEPTPSAPVETPVPPQPTLTTTAMPPATVPAPASVETPATVESVKEPVKPAAPTTPVAPVVAPIITPAVTPAVPAPAPAAVIAPEKQSESATVATPATAIPATKAPVKPVKKSVTSSKHPHSHTKTSSTAKQTEVQRAWTFYHEAVSREVSDYEKIEILGSMLMRFGEAEAGEINAELGRIRARMNRTSGKNSPNK